MNESRIQDLVMDLESLVPKEGGRVSFQIYGGGPDESRIVANKIGYYRLGIELIKAGFKPAESIEEDKSEIIDIELSNLVDKKSEIEFDWFKRTEHWSENTQPQVTPWQLKSIGITLAVLLVAGLVMAVIGIIATIRFFAG